MQSATPTKHTSDTGKGWTGYDTVNHGCKSKDGEDEMIFEQLQEKIGQQDKTDWHQHSNGGGWVHKSATVDASAYIGENAIVLSGEDTCALPYTCALPSPQVSGNAWVSGDAWVKSPLFIVGSRHSLTNARHGYIQIGCHCKTIDWWLENYKDIGKKEGYTEEEIAEYGAYIKLFKKVGK